MTRPVPLYKFTRTVLSRAGLLPGVLVPGFRGSSPPLALVSLAG